MPGGLSICSCTPQMPLVWFVNSMLAETYQVIFLPHSVLIIHSSLKFENVRPRGSVLSFRYFMIYFGGSLY
jgi:hypothetical protein